MKMKEDLTMTNKQMLVAQLRKEQEQNRILRIELEKAKRENKAEIERLNSNNGFLQCVISHSKDMMDEAVKEAQKYILGKFARELIAYAREEMEKFGMDGISASEIKEFVENFVRKYHL